MEAEELINDDWPEKRFPVEHVLSNPSHSVKIWVNPQKRLMFECTDCGWWDSPAEVEA